MSSPHPYPHHHHHCNSHHYYSPSCCCYSSAASCCCCGSSSPPPSLPPPPSNTTTAAADPLLHALADHLLLLHSPIPSPPPLYSYPHLKPYPSPQTHQPPPHDHHHQQQLLHSLHRRISALESSSLPSPSPPPHPPTLHAHSKRSPSPKKHLFSHPPPPPPPPPPQTLQDLAARTIQTHFRLFLVRRSQTLRHLKHLASIKSRVAALRSSLSDKTHLHPGALSEPAMALLLELDAIQGGDPMIREGKRSISRELTRMLDFVDKVLVKEKELMEIPENAYKVIPPTRTGKKVSFLENEKGKRSPVSSASHEPFSEKRDLLQRLRRDSGENGIHGSHHQLNGEEEEEEEEEDEEEEEEEEKSSESNSESPKAKLGLSAPLPVQMEPRRLTASR